MAKILGKDADGVRKVMRGGDYFTDFLGQLSLGIMGNVIAQLSYFYTDKVGVAVGSVGVMMAIAKVVDALTDIWFGNVIDHSKGGNRKYYRWMIRLAIPAALITVGMFTLPAGAPQGVKLAYVLITNILFSAVIYTMIATPFSAVMVVRTHSQEERSKMGLFRAIAGYGSGMFIAIATIPVTNALGGTQSAWIKYGTVLALLIVLCFLICYRNGMKATFAGEDDEKEAEIEEEEKVPFKEAVRMLFHNKYWVIVLLFNLITAVTNGIAGSSGTYYCKWIFGNDNLVAIIGAVGVLATFAGFAASNLIIKKLGVRRTILVSLLGASIAAGIRCIRPDNLPMYIGTSLVGSFVQIPMMCLYGVVLAMAVDYNEWKYDKKLVAVSSGAIGFGNKVGGGIGTVVLMGFLALGHYDAGLAAATPSMKMAIYAFANFFPIAINLLMFFIFLGFDIEKKLPQMRREVEERHAKNA